MGASIVTNDPMEPQKWPRQPRNGQTPLTGPLPCKQPKGAGLCRLSRLAYGLATPSKNAAGLSPAFEFQLRLNGWPPS